MKSLKKTINSEASSVNGDDQNEEIIKSKSKKDLNLSYDILQELSKKGQVSSFDIGKTPWVDVESPVMLERKSEDIRKIIGQIGQA